VRFRAVTCILTSLAALSGIASGNTPVHAATKKLTRAASTVVVAAVGDVACAPTSPKTATDCHDGEVANLISADASIRKVLLLGDLQYDRGEADAFAVSYDRSFGRFRSLAIPVPGNHEYGTGNASGYFGYFGPAAHPESNGYYSVNVGSWHVVALNSNCEHVSCAVDSEQLRWLRADLAANSKPCVAAMWHHPRFSSSEHGNDERSTPFWNELVAAKADVILNGHDHFYERYEPQDANAAATSDGPRSFVVGTGGRLLYSVKNIQPNSAKRITGFGFLRLELQSGSYSWKFVPDGETTTDTDTGAAKCLKKPHR
jgi:acid phosphatase type 7